MDKWKIGFFSSSLNGMNVLFGRGGNLLRGAGDQSRLRRLNALAVIEAIRHDPLTIPAIAQATGLSKTASDTVVGLLVDLGWVTAEQPLTPTGAGRPASRYRFRAEAAVVLGIDIGRHTVRVEMADLNGDALRSGEASVRVEQDPEQLIGEAVRVADRLLDDAGLTRGDVWSLGVAFPAVVDDGVVVRGAEGWNGFDIRGAFAERFAGLIEVDNDSNLAALAEAWKGSATRSRCLVYIHSGVRTGSGLVFDGEIFRGAHGAAGEVGALNQLGWQGAQAHLDDVTTEHGVLLHREEVFAAAREGDTSALEAVDRFAHAIATGIAALILTVDPDIVVVGGGNARADEVFFTPLRHYVDELCIVNETPPITASALQERASVTGAVALAASSVLERLYRVLMGGEALPRADAAALTSGA